MRVACLAVVVVLTAACDEGIGPSDVDKFDRSAFVDARARRQTAGITNYTIESRNLCFCPPHLNFWARLTVRDNNIVSAEPVEPLPSNIQFHIAGWQTVPQLFDTIESAASEGNLTSKVSVSYDPALGFPREVSIECGPTIVDCDRGHFLRSLTRLP
jgi:hypothetical protein